MNANIAIIGSIGQNAAAWTDAFLAEGFTVRNLVRFPERLPKHPGRQYARLDLDDSSTFQSALKGIQALGLITPGHPDQVKRDIADVAVAVAGGDFDDQALTLTGREAIGGERVSNLLGQAMAKPVRFVSPDLENFRSALAENKLPDWHIGALTELYARVQEGRASHVSSVCADIENVTGKRPRSFVEFAQDAFGRRGARRHSAQAQVSRRFWHHLFHHDLSREREWPIGFRL